jgi:hypothetical protein
MNTASSAIEAAASQLGISERYALGPIGIAMYGIYPSAPLGLHFKLQDLERSHSDMLAALESLLPLAEHTSPQDIAVTQARALIARAKGIQP